MPTHEPPPANDAHYAQSLTRIRHVSRVGVYTEPVIATAAMLLRDLERTGAEYDVTGMAFSAVTNLPGACLDVISDMTRGTDRVREAAIAQGYPSTQDLAVHLAGVLHTELVDTHGAPGVTKAGPWAVTFTVAGTQRRSVRAGADGWHYDCDGPGPVHMIAAPYTDDGARAIATVIAAVIAGTRPDPMINSRAAL